MSTTPVFGAASWTRPSVKPAPLKHSRRAWGSSDDNALMSSRRFVVIGAGILGASVAARLAAAGLRVTLLDQDRPGHATSRWSFAWINSNDKTPRPYHDLNHAGMRAWAELARDLDGTAWYRP